MNFIYLNVIETNTKYLYSFYDHSIDTVKNYVDEFNKLAATVKEKKSDWTGINLTISQHLEKSQNDTVKVKRILIELFDLASEFVDQITKLVSGYPEHIVDGIFKMNEIRPVIKYNYYIMLNIWFEDKGYKVTILNLPNRIDTAQSNFKTIVDIIRKLLLFLDDCIYIPDPEYDDDQDNFIKPTIKNFQISYQICHALSPPNFAKTDFFTEIFKLASDEDLQHLVTTYDLTTSTCFHDLFFQHLKSHWISPPSNDNFF